VTEVELAVVLEVELERLVVGPVEVTEAPVDDDEEEELDEVVEEEEDEEEESEEEVVAFVVLRAAKYMPTPATTKITTIITTIAIRETPCLLVKE
jgi:hypothetical protein